MQQKPELGLSLKERWDSHCIHWHSLKDCIRLPFETPLQPHQRSTLSWRLHLGSYEIVSCHRANQLYLPPSSTNPQIRRREKRTVHSVRLLLVLCTATASLMIRQEKGRRWEYGLSWKSRTGLISPVLSVLLHISCTGTNWISLHVLLSPKLCVFLAFFNKAGCVFKGPNSIIWVFEEIAHMRPAHHASAW